MCRPAFFHHRPVPPSASAPFIWDARPARVACAEPAHTGNCAQATARVSEGMADGEQPAEGADAAANAPPPKPFTLSFAAPAKPRPVVPVGGTPDDGGVVRELIKGVEGACGRDGTDGCLSLSILALLFSTLSPSLSLFPGGRVATVAPPAPPTRSKAKPVIPKLVNTFQLR